MSRNTSCDSDPGIFASCRPSTARLDQADPRKPACWATRLSKATSSTEFVFDAVAESALPLRVQPTVSPSTRVRTSSNSSDESSPLPKSEPVKPWVAFELSTLTRPLRTPPTNTTRLSWSTHTTKSSAVTPTCNGSPPRSTSDEMSAASPLLARSLAVLARDTCSTRPSVVLDAPPGRETIPNSSDESDKRNGQTEGCHSGGNIDVSSIDYLFWFVSLKTICLR